MLRSALAWTLTAAFLVTIPVTGACPCPCRLVQVLRTPLAQPRAFVPDTPPKCKCCHGPRGDTAPAHREDAHQKPTPPAPPTDGPCDHHFAVDAAVTGGPSEWQEQARGFWDANPAVDVGGYTTSCPALDSVTVPLEPTPMPSSRAHLRYAHSFRC